MTPISAEEWRRQLANAVPSTEAELADAVDETPLLQARLDALKETLRHQEP